MPGNDVTCERGGLSRARIVELLCLRGDEQTALHNKASAIRKANLSDSVYIRPLVEFSNICNNDCFYCGLRRSNNNIKRFELKPEEILAVADDASDAGINSIVLQSGERRDRKFTSYVSYTLKLIKEKHPRMCITLAAGEQERGVYEEFFEYGASRYILRIETTNEEHFKKLHPESQSFKHRLQSLHELKEIGFQIGTGVMVNAPFQTLENLADDIFFFSLLDLELCSLGPYIPHSDTPFGGIEYLPEETLNLGLNMISVVRLALPDVNIASTASLDSLSSDGKELGLAAGANVILPRLSSSGINREGALDDDKLRGVMEYRSLLKNLEARIIELGYTPDAGETADNRYYMQKVNSVADK
ncbi:MAG TPA: [FeFe] hydrogenase H-cluster radical SAM maturase HydE [Spirochaetota bacterium]|nr:[FeFe] hydrogenase H-cluster radical SAM maturase HydE [Spirochaetota bacterium]HPJ42712.1 [FeFe] hydrogenase H-cluster radical SAM maturase HydE [Spirochaetota bacterium]HPR36206.1 [FeFe] hydrogenase H-cluster radical SAM maturase HydE [Spirochaetota bacterium]HRX46115.1 [FeFe] hydrogenase H-cluster radical SAM maturase HydE [Spirochaetota bacterium]